MIRFLGDEFGFDINLVIHTVAVRRLCRDHRRHAEWRHTGVELTYPIPSAFAEWRDQGPTWHIWNLAWDDLARTNPRGSEMLRELVVKSC